MLFNPIETATEAEMQNTQSIKLHKLILRAFKKTTFYYERMAALGLTPDDFKYVDDIRKMPLLSSQDLASNYPFGLLTVPLSGITRFRHGSLEQLYSVGFVKSDLSSKAEAVARILASCNITMGSVLMIDSSVGQESALSLRQAAETLGITVVAGINDAKLQVQSIIDLGITTIFSSPDRMIELESLFNNMGISDIPLMSILCEAQYCSEQIRENLDRIFNVPVYRFYGRPDIMNLGIAGDCYKRDGMHVQEDYFLLEIIDADTLIPLPDGQQGELVVTTLAREGMPLIRYRTGEIATLTRSRCLCGRTLARLKVVI